MDEKVLKSIIYAVEEGKKMALVTLTSSKGSTPRKEGSLMSVDEKGNILGSVGGGKIESLIVERAIECLKRGKEEAFSYNLEEEGVEMACGGALEGYIKVFLPKPNLIIFGGGHISQSLCKITDSMNFRRVVVEDREEYRNYDAFKNVEDFKVASNFKEIEDINFNNSYIVIVTRGHKNDTYWAKELIKKDYKYMGVIGSSKKVLKLREDLLEEGVFEEDIKRMKAPIGLDIADGSPEEIAISILAEILLVKNKGRLAHLQDVKMKRVKIQ